MSSLLPSHPILDCTTSAAHEAALLRGEEAREWTAMQRAAQGLASGLQQDLRTAGAELAHGRLLVLAGKGHNGGDALLAAALLARAVPTLAVDVAFVFGSRACRPLALAAARELEQAASGRVRPIRLEEMARRYTLILDGVFGFRFRPPLPDLARTWLTAVQGVTADLRAAVDLPSGLNDADAFRADVTYATGIVKSPLLELHQAGRLRYLDLGFFNGDEPAQDRVLLRQTLAPLRGLRPPHSDKRAYGHLYVVGGSRRYPGAILMSVQAALLSGIGLVTAFVPESLAPAFAAAWPEAIWQGCPETAEGSLALDAGAVIRGRLDRANALLMGPGLGREPDALAVITSLVREARLPIILDADALQSQIVWAGSAPRILTPHAGEFDRIAVGSDLRSYRPTHSAVTVLKGPVTRISDGSGRIYHSLAGGPVLARGGSGDLLAGMIGAQVAQQPQDLLLAAARAVVWHGAAADRLAQTGGEVAVRTTALLDHLGPVLRELR